MGGESGALPGCKKECRTAAPLGCRSVHHRALAPGPVRVPIVEQDFFSGLDVAGRVEVDGAVRDADDAGRVTRYVLRDSKDSATGKQLLIARAGDPANTLTINHFDLAAATSAAGFLGIHLDDRQQLVMAQIALERDYEAQREIDTRYRVLMETTRDAIVVVSMTTGRIVDLNIAAAVMLGGSRQDMIGAAIAQEFEGRRRGEFLESMANLAIADSSSPLELQARRSHKRLLVVPTVFRAAGERLLMCRLELADVGDAQRDELTENLFGLFHEGADSVVFADMDGMIRSANEAFLNLTDSSSLAAVKGRSFGEFLARGAVDLRVLSDNARRVGQMRMYGTKVNAAYGGQISVEISATYLNDRPQPFFVFVVRDTSRAEALRRPGLNVTEDGGRSIMELVGSSTLKDIVAETTDVVEKMCIETAVELTRNNRVAAAEMLGLSRQSLYVKLRKYGLVGNEGDQP